MPRPAKPVRLWLQPERRDASGRLLERATWIILDRGKKNRTGCGAGERAQAERHLEDYLASRRQVSGFGKRHPTEIPVSDVIQLYAETKATEHADPAETQGRLDRLLNFWGDKMLSDVNGTTCRAYVASRSSRHAARRELEDLRAAINLHRKEGLCSEIVGVALPEKAQARDRWLTRKEAAALIWAAWRYREVQKGKPTERYSRRHVARFILIGLYTGTRSSAICGAALGKSETTGWVDLDRGVFYRRAATAKVTKKRQTPVTLPSRLLAHMRRWKRMGLGFAVEWNGKPVRTLKKAFKRAVSDARVDDQPIEAPVTPHTLRHTSATWLMQRGVDPWEAAGYLGMTVQTLIAVYGHHHPDHQQNARAAFDAPGMIPERNLRTDRDSAASNRTNVVRFAR